MDGCPFTDFWENKCKQPVFWPHGTDWERGKKQLCIISFLWNPKTWSCSFSSIVFSFLKVCHQVRAPLWGCYIPEEGWCLTCNFLVVATCQNHWKPFLSSVEPPNVRWFTPHFAGPSSPDHIAPHPHGAANRDSHWLSPSTETPLGPPNAQRIAWSFPSHPHELPETQNLRWAISVRAVDGAQWSLPNWHLENEIWLTSNFRDI